MAKPHPSVLALDRAIIEELRESCGSVLLGGVASRPERFSTAADLVRATALALDLAAIWPRTLIAISDAIGGEFARLQESNDPSSTASMSSRGSS